VCVCVGVFKVKKHFFSIRKKKLKKINKIQRIHLRAHLLR